MKTDELDQEVEIDSQKAFSRYQICIHALDFGAFSQKLVLCLAYKRKTQEDNISCITYLV